MKYLAVLGRQPEISLAELESLFFDVVYKKAGDGSDLAVFSSKNEPKIGRLGGSLKIAKEIPEGFNSIIEYLLELPDGKITLGISDYRKKSRSGRGKASSLEALKIKQILKRRGRSVRVLENKTNILSTATSHHNQIAEKKNHIELILTDFGNYSVIGVQNISEYAKRDRMRPARDAKVGMLPPKLAQILLNLCGELSSGSRVLDPFCGTGVVLQEAFLDGYSCFGTDLNPRMIDYSKRNLDWIIEKMDFKNSQAYKKDNSAEKTGVNLTKSSECAIMKRYSDYILETGDATELDWRRILAEKGQKQDKIDAVASEVYLGQPMSKPPVSVKLKQEKQTCKVIILGFLKNLSGQIRSGTPVCLAIPAWLRENGEYSRLNILDEIRELGYNVVSFKNLSQEDLLYHREGQIVAREIIVLRKQ